MNRRETGSKYERAAGAFLEGMGYRILEYNFRCRQGEIDIIAKDGLYLVFVEVKYRSGRSAGSPQEAVGRGKQKKISRVALYYLWRKGLGQDTSCRFDVVAIEGTQISVIKNAFDFCE